MVVLLEVSPALHQMKTIHLQSSSVQAQELQDGLTSCVAEQLAPD